MCYWEQFLAVRIPLAALRHNRVYRIAARNSCVGIFDEHTTGYTIARTKMGRSYLFEEFDWEIRHTALPFHLKIWVHVHVLHILAHQLWNCSRTCLNCAKSTGPPSQKRVNSSIRCETRG